MRYLLIILLGLTCRQSTAQVDESATGAWYMYFYNFSFDDSQFGLEGDFQYRDWETFGDLETVILRSAITYTPRESDLHFALGFAHFTNGEPGDSADTSGENRFHQDVGLPQKFGDRFYVGHRFRFEQRFVDSQDFRTRYRYRLALNVPLNKTAMEKGSVYLSLYDEVFINGQTDIGNGRATETYDRNWAYVGLGYVAGPGAKVQFGWLHENTGTYNKGQLQFSFHHTL